MLERLHSGVALVVSLAACSYSLQGVLSGYGNVLAFKPLMIYLGKWSEVPKMLCAMYLSKEGDAGSVVTEWGQAGQPVSWVLLGVMSSDVGGAREARGSLLGLASHLGVRWGCTQDATGVGSSKSTFVEEDSVEGY